MNKNEFDNLKGMTSIEAKKLIPSSYIVRTVTQGGLMTADFVPERLNLIVNNTTGIIEEVFFG